MGGDAGRHLNESQRAIIAARLANMKQGNFSKAANLPLSPISQSKAADLLSVGERSVRSARHVLTSGIPELAQAVDRGERVVGEMLANGVQHQGGRPKKRLPQVTVLPDGITKKDSHKWQRAAQIADADFEQWVMDMTADEQEISTKWVALPGSAAR